MLAIPGTLVHASLGHIDWSVVVVFGTTSIPLSYLGARMALRTNPVHLERAYGAGLALLGATLRGRASRLVNSCTKAGVGCSSRPAPYAGPVERTSRTVPDRPARQR